MISNVRTPLGNNGGVSYGTVQYFLSLSNVTIPPLLVHHYHDSVYMAIDSKYDTLSLPRESVEVCPVESFGLPLIFALPHLYLGTCLRRKQSLKLVHSFSLILGCLSLVC